MIAAGIDIGSTACKAVVLVDGRIAGVAIGPASTNPGKTADEIYARALADAGLEGRRAECVVGTGYGRARVEFADENISELTCHGRGASFVNGAVRTVLDIGGQDTKAIRVDEAGFLLDYAMNDKCAAGTGRFLDAMARTLELDHRQMDRHSEQASRAAVITSMCSVFAESEVINLINDGVEIGQIVRGLYDAMAGRVAALARRVGLEREVMLTGGVAKSHGLLRALASKIGLTPLAPPVGVDPQIIGALGAAVSAAERGAMEGE
ncbi:MAG TPA: acyl-CoA dehydratase activase [Myxococcota bacterium]|nr:acyl-CoA dehydratase activase [Myxococcota bacterium]